MWTSRQRSGRVHICLRYVSLLVVSLCTVSSMNAAQAASELRFGVVTEGGRTTQARFETTIVAERFASIVYTPYGVTPVSFESIQQDGEGLRFVWNRTGADYHCTLRRQGGSVFEGNCRHSETRTLHLTIRPFGPEDAHLQGNDLHATGEDLAILVRARTLMMEGRAWERQDNRVCDGSAYPYRWSLFCALHQASIETAREYRHLRPAVKAVHAAIERTAPGRQFAHLLQDFNNEAPNFDVILGVLADAESALSSGLISVAVPQSGP